MTNRSLMETHLPLTTDDRRDLVREIVAAFTNPEETGVVDRLYAILQRQQTYLEALTDRVERLELEIIALRPDPGAQGRRHVRLLRWLRWRESGRWRRNARHGTSWPVLPLT